MSNDFTHKDVFDAGLPPTNVDGMDRMECEVRNSELVIQTNDGLRLPLNAEHVTFSVTGDDRISEMFAQTQNTKLSLVIPKAAALLGYLDHCPSDGKRAFKKHEQCAPIKPCEN